MTTLPLDSSGRKSPRFGLGNRARVGSARQAGPQRDLRFQYDDRDRLAVVRRQLTAETTEVVATYEYDIEGRRVERETGGVKSKPSGTVGRRSRISKARRWSASESTDKITTISCSSDWRSVVGV